MLPVSCGYDFIHDSNGVGGLKVMRVQIDEGLYDDRFGFLRKVFKEAPEDTGGALIGFKVLLVVDVFGGGKKGLGFYWTHCEV